MFIKFILYSGKGKAILSKAQTLCDIPDLVQKSLSKRNKKKTTEEFHKGNGKNKIKLDRLFNHLEYIFAKNPSKAA